MRSWLLILLAIATLFGGGAAHAAPMAAPCTAQSSLSTTVVAIELGQIAADCSADRWSIVGPRSWLLFDAKTIDRVGAGPLEVVVRASRFDRISLFARYADGSTAALERDGDGPMPYRMAGPVFALAVPDQGAKVESIAVAIDGPGYGPTLSATQLVTKGGGGWTQGTMMMIAMFIGLALAPLLFNFAFYRVLRERFLVWHMALAWCIFIHTMLASGLAFGLFPEMGNRLYGFLSQGSFSLGIATASMFALHFIEPDCLGKRDRQALLATVVWIPVFTFITMMPIEAARIWGNKFYFAAFFPVLLVYAVVLFRALARGSRAARFQTLAWTPIILCGLERVTRGIGLYVGPEWLDQLLYLAISLELVITTIGVADRFMILRRASDQAHARADVMASAAATDPLTALANRRGLEQALRQQDRYFTGAALIDIDHFKAVNDLYGHQTGDAVLRAAAGALLENEIGVVARIGGEEFFLLIERADAAAAAEQARMGIKARVAADAARVSHPVTASGGLLIFESALAGTSLDFDRLYVETDRLLYAAKHSGRDCMVADRWVQPDGAQPAANATQAA